MSEPSGVLERCFGLVDLGRVTEAEFLATETTRACPDHGEAWLVLGLIRYRQGNHFAAAEALETAGLLIPLDAPTRSIMAECLVKSGQIDLGCHLYDLLANDPKTPDQVLPSVAAGLGQLGDYARALKVCLTMARRTPGLPEAHFGVAFYLRKLGRSVESVLPIVARAHELAPEVPLYRISLATLLDQVGRSDEARDLLQDLDLDTVSCRGCVQRMTTIFRATGDENRSEPLA